MQIVNLKVIFVSLQLALPMIAGGRTAVQGLFYLIRSGAPAYFASQNFTQGMINNTMKIIGQTQTAADGK